MNEEPSHQKSNYTSALTPVPPESPGARVKRRLRAFLDRRSVQLLLVGLFGIASMAIALVGQRITPFTLVDPSGLPAIEALVDTDDEGTPLLERLENSPELPGSDTPTVDTIGGRASRDIRATHTFKRVEILNLDAEQKRQEAIDRVHPIWVYDPTIALNANTRIIMAFNFMRTTLCNEAVRSLEIEAQGDATPAESDVAKEDAQNKMMRQCTQRGLAEGQLTSRERVAIACSSEMRQRIGKRLDIPELDEDVCKRLAEEGATIEAQRALHNYYADLMLSPIVESDEALSSLKRTLDPTKPAADRGFRLDRSAGSSGNDNDDTNYSMIITSLSDFRTLEGARESARSGNDTLLGLTEDQGAAAALRNLAATLIEANTTFDAASTSEARDAAAGRITNSYESRLYRRGEVILHQDNIITHDVVETLAQMKATAPRTVAVGWEALSLAILLGLVTLGIWLLSRDADYFWSTRDITMMGLVLVLQLGLVRLGFFLSELAFLKTDQAALSVAVLVAIPFAAGSLVVKTLTSTRHAVAFTMLASVLVAAVSGYEFAWFAISLASGVIGPSVMGTVDRRGAVLRGVAASTAAVILLIVGFGARGMLDGALHIVGVSAATSIAFIGTAIVALSVPSLIEFVFRYTTPSTLQELLSSAHPLRIQLQRAAGTMMHSDAVAELTASGAEAIGANALLARVGGIFHDVGKIRAPANFGENNILPNPHDELTFRESATRIIAHVRHGVEEARRYNLPEEVIEFIQTHHGEMVVRHFYNKTCQDEGLENVDLRDFQYPGPLPSTKETAICLMADGIEAAVRANPDKSAETIRATVHRMIDAVQSEGQLINSGLTLGEVQTIKETFIAKLRAMHHSRPVYAQAVKAEPKDTPTSSEHAATTPASSHGDLSGTPRTS